MRRRFLAVLFFLQIIHGYTESVTQEIRLHCDLLLGDPFMIASSHWTASGNALKKIAAVNPAAVTLKTTSIRYGSRAEDSLGRRNQRLLKNLDGMPFARFTDGPKPVEFWDLTTTGQYLEESRNLMPGAKIGISVLQGENYEEIRTYLAKFHKDNYDYVELNLKYSARQNSMNLGEASYYKDLENYFKELYEDVITCSKVFQGIPFLVKFPRELVPFFTVPEISSLLECLFERRNSVILANSLRTFVPRSFDKNSDSLESGVVTGDHLFMSTYNAICQLDQKYLGNGFIVASGGVSNIPTSLDVFVAGASAVQLCTALDDRGVNFLKLLRQQLLHCQGEQPFLEYINLLSSTPEHSSSEVAKSKTISKSSLSKVAASFENAEAELIPIFQRAIEVELARVNLLQSSTEPKIPTELAIVQARGNLSGYAIQKIIIEEHNGQILDVGTAGELPKKMRDAEFTYDLAIMPRSIFDELCRQPKAILGLRNPVELLVIGASQSTLVGLDGCTLENVANIYHFDGPTARSALLRLSKEQSLASPSIEVIHKSELQALLAFWPRRSAILAKPPLNWMYGFLAPEVDNRWVAFWESSEDLLLVGSEQFVNNSDPGVLSGICSMYIEVARRVASDPLHAAQSCLDLQLITYLRNLLDVA